MERLTKRDSGGNAAVDCDVCELGESRLANCGVLKCRNRLKDRLAAYEDTGLTPEDVKRVHDLLLTVQRLKTEQFEILEKYLEAEAEGRMMALPCKVGQEVFTVEDAAIYCAVDGAEEVDHILEFEFGDCGLTFSTEWYEPRPVEEIGKTVFFSREEAERALNGSQD